MFWLWLLSVFGLVLLFYLFIFFSPWWFMCVSECVWELPTYLNTYTYISLFICPALSCQPNRLGKLAEQVLCDKSGCLLCCLVCFCVFTFVIYFAWSFVMLSHSSLFFSALSLFFFLFPMSFSFCIAIYFSRVLLLSAGSWSLLYSRFRYMIHT